MPYLMNSGCELRHDDYRRAHDNFRDMHHYDRGSHHDRVMVFVSGVPALSTVRDQAAAGGKEGGNAD